MIMKTIVLMAVAAAASGLITYNNNGSGQVESRGFYTNPPQNSSIDLTPKSAGDKIKGAVPSENIQLSKSNLLVFRGQVDGLSVGKAQNALLEMHKNLPKGKPIYMVLDTPGGDIVAGNQLIDTAHSLGRPVHSITIFAASMGFAFAQRLDKRYILPSGTLMAHRARVGGVEGQIPGEFITAAATLYNLVLGMEKLNAARMGISMDAYTSLVKDEYWVDGEEAVRQGVADATAKITCDSSLNGSSSETVDTFFGPISLEWANCPAVTQPLGFKIEGPGAGDKMKNTEITKNIKELVTARNKLWGKYLK